jgi:hypothetical protein
MPQPPLETQAQVSTTLPETATSPAIATETSQPTETAAPALTLEVLKNFTYLVPDFNIEAVLQQGIFTSSDTRVELVEPAAFGDINGDGLEDAVVVLVVDPSGSGTFYNLVAVLNQGGMPVQAAFSYIGDRQGIKNLEITAGEIILDFVTQGPNDPLCCASEEHLRTYRFENGELLVIGDQIVAAP